MTNRDDKIFIDPFLDRSLIDESEYVPMKASSLITGGKKIYIKNFL